ncbi:hypothetical protein, partial [Staphylococcus epidermidis]|uniref:hypothetical protein n=1 Tax=Staphylococcus epidermidis TaxID=1282 RepID=UPI0021B28928
MFQFQSHPLTTLLKTFQPQHFQHILPLTSLYTPPPIQQIPTYITPTHNPNQLPYLHPHLQPILKNTY